MKKFTAILLLVAMVSMAAFASVSWTTNDQKIGLEGVIEGSSVSGMKLIASYKNTNYVNGNTISDLPLNEKGEVSFQLINSSFVNLVEAEDYDVSFLVDSFVTDGGSTEGLDKMTVTLNNLSASSNAGTEVGTQRYQVKEVKPTGEAQGAVNVNYLAGQTAAEETFAKFTVNWDGSTTLKPGTYEAAVTATFVKN